MQGSGQEIIKLKGGEKTPKKESVLQDGATTKDINNRIGGHRA